MTDSEKRLKILDESEIQELYGFPCFSQDEREIYFHLEPLEKEEINNLRSIPSKVYFILQLGYFKSKRMFFTFGIKEIEEDTKYILQRYFPEADEIESQNIEIWKSTKLDHQARILTLLNYKHCSPEVKQALLKKAHSLATICTKPIFIFKELINYLENNRIVIPGYSVMQEHIIGKALTDERTRLESVILHNISEEIQIKLMNLIFERENFYLLTFLKKEPKDFTYGEISEEVNKRKSLSNFYKISSSILPLLGISNENVKYYASLVEYYTIYKLQRMAAKSNIVTAYLLCFVYNRYQKVNENLVNTFIYYVRGYIADAKDYAKEKVYDYKMEGNKGLNNLSKILDLFTDDSISDDIEFGQVKEIAFGILEKEKFPFLSTYISKTRFDQKEFVWDYYSKIAQKFKKNIRYIFLNLDFQCQNPEDPLLKAVSFLKDVFQKQKSLNQIKEDNFPLECIKAKKYLYDTKSGKDNDGNSYEITSLNVNKYEFLIYSLLMKGLESGGIFVRDSINFRSFEEDLIDDATWENRYVLIKNLNIPYLHTSITEILDSLKQLLEIKIDKVNKRIKTGENVHIKITGKGDNIKWSLPYKKDEDVVNNPFYGKFRQIGISDVLHFVDEHCDFMSAFTHILSRYVKSSADNHLIIGCITAYATNMGLLKTADISDVSHQELVSTSDNFIRLETLKNANDKISNGIAGLPVYKHYNIEEDIVHSSSDGQKFETRFHTINARYSPKYFGLKKGVVDCSLIANHIPINAKIIGANESESHYVFDLLYNNTSEIVPQIHSTDTHGTNEVNFAILHMFGYRFAPRYRNLKSKAEKIYGFKNPKEYDASYLLKPARKLNEMFIVDEWDNVLRIILSLALKSTTQSTIIRKLSSYERKNRTKKALWEFDNIIKSLHILEFVDSPAMRKNVYRALNRIESYHKLKRAIFHDNFGRFRVNTEVEQQIWSECARLIANSIIFYNAFILSKLLEKKEKLEQFEEAAIIKKIPPVAWRHINFYGQFEFHDNGDAINIDEIIESLDEDTVDDVSVVEDIQYPN